MSVVVKIARSPIEPRLANAIDFDHRDAEEWGIYAIKHNAWRTFCGQSAPRINTYDIETVVTIAAPDGRVAVWYGRATTIQPTRTRGKSYRRRDATCYEAALGATKCRAASMLWDDRCTRGGERDVSALAMAACRILHAEVFEYAPSARDRLLAEFATLVGAARPATPHIIKASDAALEAACALLSIKNYQAVRALLAGKGACGS